MIVFLIVLALILIINDNISCMNDLLKLPSIGPKTQALLQALNITTPTDLLYHFPHRYIDFSRVSLIKDLEINQTATITGKVISFQNIYTHSSKNIQKAKVSDSSGIINLIWFNQPYLSKTIIVGDTQSFAGTVSEYLNKPTIIAPFTGDQHTGKIIAIYPETKGLTSNWFRKIIGNQINHLLASIVDPLPSTILNSYKLPDLKTALYQIHCPQNSAQLNLAIKRLSLQEILSLQSRSLLLRQHWQSQQPHQIFFTNPLIEKQLTKLIQSLPFSLTSSQVAAWADIKHDLLLTTPTNRLLQGDVGSGKTIVALLAAYLAHLNKSTTLILAPTAILAQQHFHTFKQFLPRLPITLLTSATKIKFKPPQSGDIIIATHAAIYQTANLKDNIGLLIVDEQHKFGVTQRSFLHHQLSPPHCLTMTATPIPRTIALTFLGHLDLSVLTDTPHSRSQIKTYLVPPVKQTACFLWLKKHIQQTREQAFIACPFIDVSETLLSVKAAKVEYQKFQTIYFPEFKLGLIHGQIKGEAKNQIMSDFGQNKINILVSTPVIEVGIDFPNATTIIILSADRFGLAQLHQLRGRIGRSSRPGYCYLFSDSNNAKAMARLQFLENHHLGQQIAEYDLITRGPGETFATLQHGFPSLKLASLSDTETIKLGQKIIKKLQLLNFDLKKLTQDIPSNLSATN